MVTTPSMKLLRVRWLAGCYTYPETWMDCMMSKMHSVNQGSYSRVEDRQQEYLRYPGSDLQWHQSVSICQAAQVQDGWKKGILCHPFQVVRPKPCQYDSIRSQDVATDVYIWWRKEGMKLGKVCCPTCQVPYYTGKPDGIWVLRPWSRIEGSICAGWH